MNLKFIINKALTTPPHIFIRKVYFVLVREAKYIFEKKRDYIFTTFSSNNTCQIDCSYVDIKNIEINDNFILELISKNYIQHKFDFLGSGWVENSYDSIAFGVEGYQYSENIAFKIDNLINISNRKTSKEIYSLVDNNYRPIDWQKDSKSGFRWSEKEWFTEQRNSVLGADLKMVWDMSRLQHLPQLALYASTQKENILYIKELRNELLDFIALNPPRFGVTWTCTMDVGIRAMNMALSYDIFNQLDSSCILDKEFKRIFACSLYEHGLHIVNNLEYNEDLTSNHYLSDIVGLLFVASYLKCSNDEVTQWLAFAIQEIISEMEKEFYPDGSNFEASTSYHRLSTELMVYATSLILGLNSKIIEDLKQYSIKGWHVRPALKKPSEQLYTIIDNQIELPNGFSERLYKAVMFTYNITKPTGEIPQIGDNDSGRCFRLSPNGELLILKEAKEKYKSLVSYQGEDKDFWDENILNHTTLLSAMSGLYESEAFQTDFEIEKQLVQTLAKNRKLKFIKSELSLERDKNSSFDSLEYKSEKIFTIEEKEQSLLDNLEFIPYPYTGLYLFKSDRLYLIVSAGSNGQNGNGGHAHNDKLSFELNIDGKDIVVDPGTYLYTSFPDERNKFRSTEVHNTLIVEAEEQNGWLEGRSGLFSMKNQSKCYLLDYGQSFVDVAVEYRGIKQRRKFTVEKERIVIENYSNKEFSENYNNFKLYSNGYGKLVNI